MKVIVIGNSVGITVRPPRTSREEGNVSEILAARRIGEEHIHVENRCRGAHVLNDLVERDLDYIAANAPDYVLVISGINEAVSRPLPRSLFQFLNKRRPLRSGFVSALLRLNGGFNRFLFPLLIRFMRLKGWYRAGRYAADLRVVVDEIHKETGCLVVVSTILPCGDRIEKLLPGSRASIREFNDATKEVLRDATFVEIVDLGQVIEAGKEGEYIPDGIHMNARAHRLLAERMFDIITSHESSLH